MSREDKKMEQFTEGESTREEIKNKLRQNFDGKIVRKDLTKKIKEGANVPVYVLEFLLDQYCSSDDESVIEKGVQNVKRILADEYSEKFDRLLCGGIWCIVQLDYEVEGDNNFGIEDIDGNPLRSKQKKQKDISPISIRKLTPIQTPHMILMS